MEKDYTNLTDVELYSLLRDVKEKAERAFAELYNRYSPRIYNYCRRFLNDKDEAQDVYQETFIRFYQSAEKEKEMSNIPAFLIKIARNLCVNKKKRNKQNISLENIAELQEENRDEKDELMNLINISMELLPTDYKEAFLLREYEGMTYAEIAEITNISVSTVKIRIYRAKQKLRSILSPYMSEVN